MRHLLDSSVWLLIPGPREEERSTGSAVASLLLAVFFVFNGIFFDSYGLVPNFMEPSFGAPIDRPAVMFFAAILLLFSVLHALPPHRGRARLGARIIPHARRSGVRRLVSAREDGRIRRSGRGPTRAGAPVRQPFLQPPSCPALAAPSDGLGR